MALVLALKITENAGLEPVPVKQHSRLEVKGVYYRSLWLGGTCKGPTMHQNMHFATQKLQKKHSVLGRGTAPPLPPNQNPGSAPNYLPPDIGEH